MKFTISKKIDTLLFLMVFIAAANVAVLFHYHSQQKDDSHVVNVAGRQRMLSQKISKLALSVANGNESDRRLLGEAIKLYETSLTALEYGGDTMKIPPAPIVMKGLFNNNKRSWGLFKEKARIIVKEDRSGSLFEEAVDYIQSHNEELLSISDKVTGRFDQIFSEKFNRLSMVLIVMFGIDVILLFMGNYIANVNIAKPIIKLSEFAANVGKGDFTQEIAIPNSKDEIGDLARAFKHMTEELKETTVASSELERRVQEEVQESRQKDVIMMHQSRLAVMGEMIANIAHQWKQPLNALNILLYNIKDLFDDNKLTKDNLDDFFNKGTEMVEKMSMTVDDFKNFFKPNKKKKEFSINKTVKSSLELIDSNLRFNNISVLVNEKEELFITGYQNEYSQVVLNVINNAKDAILEKGIEGKIRINILQKDNAAIVSIKDNAGGIPETIKNKIFKPYFTTKEGKKGTGIGLYISKAIIEKHMAGCIDIQNTDGGAEFKIITPLIQHKLI